MRLWIGHFVSAISSLVLCAAAASAQGSIAGTGVTRGRRPARVTVEAASPALIEKARSVVTDSAGEYKIIDLRPGTYTVTLTLSGFTVVKREGLVLSASLTLPVNAELARGTLEETITVTGETPTVDVQNVRQQSVMTRDAELHVWTKLAASNHDCAWAADQGLGAARLLKPR